MIDAEYAIQDVLDDVYNERKRQDAKWGVQNHPDAVAGLPYPIAVANQAREITEDRAKNGTISFTDILLEEVAEATDEALAGNREALREELIQVAAVAVAWVEKIDRGL